MRRLRLIPCTTIFGLFLGVAGTAAAQARDQTINVRILPATSVEDKVANDLKEKELRKAAEEKRLAEEAARISETSPRVLLSRAPALHYVRHRILRSGAVAERAAQAK